MIGLGSAARAEALVYWSTLGPREDVGFDWSIGAARLDGAGADPELFPIGNGLGETLGAGVAVDGGHIYWADYPAGTIGRADIDGTNIDYDFIRLGEPACGGSLSPGELAVGGGRIYWTDPDSGTIGRANLDGTGMQPGFIGGGPCGGDIVPGDVAVDAGHVYWRDNVDHIETIGRANVDGSGIDRSFIETDSTSAGYAPDGLGVDGTHIYWGSGWHHPYSIGRANLDGDALDNDFITTADYTGAVALDSGHVYWVTGEHIGRADLDGSNVDDQFIFGGDSSGIHSPVDVTVDGRAVLPPPRPPAGLIDATVRANETQRQRPPKIRIKVTVTAEERVTARITGMVYTQQLKTRTEELHAGEKTLVKLKPRNKRTERIIVKQLKKRNRVLAKLLVTLSDTDHNRETEKLHVDLK